MRVQVFEQDCVHFLRRTVANLAEAFDDIFIEQQQPLPQRRAA